MMGFYEAVGIIRLYRALFTGRKYLKRRTTNQIRNCCCGLCEREALRLRARQVEWLEVRTG